MRGVRARGQPEIRLQPSHSVATVTQLRQLLHSYDGDMRTTVDIPPLLHERARLMARESGRSLSATLADLIAVGLENTSEGAGAQHRRDPVTGLRVFNTGGRVTSEHVAELIDEEG